MNYDGEQPPLLQTRLRSILNENRTIECSEIELAMEHAAFAIDEMNITSVECGEKLIEMVADTGLDADSRLAALASLASISTELVTSHQIAMRSIQAAAYHASEATKLSWSNPF